jgi:hypothetical protein
VDLALGVAVAGPVARLTLIESGTGGQDVIDESIVDLAGDPIARLTETVVGTNRSLAEQYHRLVATRLCWSDQRGANQLRQALDESGVQNVAVLSESEAASYPPLAVPGDPEFGIARGAALGAATGQLPYPASDATMAAPAAPTGQLPYPAGDPTMAAPAAPTGQLPYPAGDPTTAAPAAPMTEAFSEAEVATRNAPAAAGESGAQLAYSMENYESELLPMEYGGEDEVEELDAAAVPAGRALLVGSAVGGILVAGIAALAVAVTIGVRPTAASHPQPPAPAQQKSVPGNFVPALPAPNAPPVPEVQAPVSVPDAGVPQSGSGPAVGGGGGPAEAPAPAPLPPPEVGPPVPGVLPLPIIVPIPIPFPHPGGTTGTTTGGTTGTTTGTTTGGTTGTTTGGTTGTTTGGTTGTTTGTTTGGTTGTTTGSTTGGTTGTTTGGTTGTTTGGTTGTTTGGTTGTTTGGTTGSTTGTTKGTTTGGTTGTTTGTTTGGTTGTTTGTTTGGTTGTTTGGTTGTTTGGHAHGH